MEKNEIFIPPIEKNRKSYSDWLKEKSFEEISESIDSHSESASFEFETRKHHVDVSLYDDNSIMVQIWNFETDTPCTKVNVERFIQESVIKWSSVESAIEESKLRLQEQYEMRRAI